MKYDENLISRELLNKISLEKSKTIDKFSNWLLGGIAASYIFFIANYEKLSPHYPDIFLFAILTLLILFLFTIFMIKFHSMNINLILYGIEVEDKINSNLIQTQTKVDFEKIKKNLHDASYFWTKCRIGKLYLKNDFLHMSKFAFKLSQKMEVYMIIQLILITSMISINYVVAAGLFYI